MKHYRKKNFKFKKTKQNLLESLTWESLLPAVGLLRGGIPRMRHGRSPAPGRHAHHRRVFLRVSVLRELRRRDAPETEEERRLPKRVLRRLARRHVGPNHVSHVKTSLARGL